MNTTPNIETVSFYFKLVHTGEHIELNVPTHLCMANFIEFVKCKIYNIFNINHNSNIELVEAGQNIEGLRAEEAPALIADKNITVRRKYNGVYTNVAFYIRILQ
jgi:hypothetical protein